MHIVFNSLVFTLLFSIWMIQISLNELALNDVTPSMSQDIIAHSCSTRWINCPVPMPDCCCCCCCCCATLNEIVNTGSLLPKIDDRLRCCSFITSGHCTMQQTKRDHHMGRGLWIANGRSPTQENHAQSEWERWKNAIRARTHAHKPEPSFANINCIQRVNLSYCITLDSENSFKRIHRAQTSCAHNRETRLGPY